MRRSAAQRRPNMAERRRPKTPRREMSSMNDGDFLRVTSHRPPKRIKIGAGCLPAHLAAAVTHATRAGPAEPRVATAREGARKRGQISGVCCAFGCVPCSPCSWLRGGERQQAVVCRSIKRPPVTRRGHGGRQAFSGIVRRRSPFGLAAPQWLVGGRRWRRRRRRRRGR